MVLIVIIVALGIDIYIYTILNRRCKSRVLAIIQIVTALLLYLLMAVAVAMPRMTGGDTMLRAIMWMLFGFSSVLIAKVIFVIFDLISTAINRTIGKKNIAISWMGAILGLTVFVLMWWGALLNRFHYNVNEIEVEIPNIPQSFDGYKIVQISDLHVGTFGNDTTFTSRLVSEINALQPDLIVFTGDIVNRHSPELLPHVKTLAGLSARHGVYSILGNHDYGDYSRWPDEDAKRSNMEQLYQLQADMNWKLLLNEHVWLHCGADSIALIGVENVGDPPFHTYGSLPRAYATPGDSAVKILLSHNPAHWNADIADNDTMNIALTLSGHTHAMQMSVMGMSPAAIRYKTWGGLYTDTSGKHKLYVNIGAGTVGIPMRLGATPEITLITLRR